MQVALFCGDRFGTYKVLQQIIDKKVEVVACVFEENDCLLRDMCIERGIPCYNAEQMYELVRLKKFPHFDLGISYLYHKILKKEIIEYGNGNIINFHPAPTEVHRGVAACCYCLMKGYKEWAVTAHFITPGIDDGDIIAQRRFSLSNVETGQEAEALIQRESAVLFDQVLSMFLSGEPIPRYTQKTFAGEYYSRASLEEDKKIHFNETTDSIVKKIHSLWMPPYHGAYIELNGKKYSLVDDVILNKIFQERQEMINCRHFKEEER